MRLTRAQERHRAEAGVPSGLVDPVGAATGQDPVGRQHVVAAVNSDLQPNAQKTEEGRYKHGRFHEEDSATELRKDHNRSGRYQTDDRQTSCETDRYKADR